MMSRQGGYTIVEVSLFLAISASLILLIVGLQSMVARQRFQDAMTSLRTTVQSEYEEVRSGINSRLGGVNITGCANDGVGNAAGSSQCLATGKLIQFSVNSSDVKTSYVVATGTIPANDGTKTDEQALRAMSLKVIGAASATTTTDAAAKPQTTKIQWGSEFAGGWTIPDSGEPTGNITSIAILRSPISSAVLVFAFTANPVNGSGVLSLTSGVVNTPVALVIRNADNGFRGAAVCVDRGSSSQAVRLAIPAETHGINIPINGTIGASNPVTGITLDNLKGLCSL
jgi:hypothetical protein